MVRPIKDRTVAFDPEVNYFKPRGIPMIDLEEATLTVDELEAIRLADLMGMSHEAGGERMGVSRATFGRIIQKAHRTIADAIINGKAINIGGGNYRLIETMRVFLCEACGHRWEESPGTGRPEYCPSCRSGRFHRIRQNENRPPCPNL